MKEINDLNTDELLKIYELFANEETSKIEFYEQRLAFYTGFISVIFAGIFAGFMKVTAWYQYIFLILGFFLTWKLSIFAKGAIFNLYKRSLETITSRAKIETLLGLTKPIKNKNIENWSEEAIIATRHLETREKFRTSKEFVETLENEGYQKTVNQIFSFITWLSILGIIFLTTIAFLEGNGLSLINGAIKIMTPQILNSFGLVLDMIAAALFFFFGIESNTREGGAGFIRLEQDDEKEAKKYIRNSRINKIAFGMLFAGFLLQFIAIL